MGKKRAAALHDWATFKSDADRIRWRDCLRGLDGWLKRIATLADSKISDPHARETARILDREIRLAARAGDVWSAVAYSIDLGRELPSISKSVGDSRSSELRDFRQRFRQGALNSAASKNSRASEYADKVLEVAVELHETHKTWGRTRLVKIAIQRTPGKKLRAASTVYGLIKDRLPPRE